MSRNLGSVLCYFCSADVKALEPAHPITAHDAGVYYQEFAGMLVADAACVDCEAEYLAWLDGRTGLREASSSHDEPTDLSFRSTFNDEPGVADLPKWRIITRRCRYRVPIDRSRAASWYGRAKSLAQVLLAIALDRSPEHESDAGDMWRELDARIKAQKV